MVRIKGPTVKFKTFTPALIHILGILNIVDKEFPEDIIITSVNDSRHAKNSAHYRDEAVDIRCNDRPYAVDLALCSRLVNLLGPSFLVLYESHGTPNEHIHIQLRKGHSWR